MKQRRKIYFIGPAGGGKPPKNGASFKNTYILEQFSALGLEFVLIDTERWRSHPFILLRLLFAVLFFRSSKFIVSTSPHSAYRLFSVMTALGLRHIVYWVIGGRMANDVKEGRYRVEVYQRLKQIVVEGQEMRLTLEKCGIKGNVSVLPNFKKIDHLPCVVKAAKGEVFRFVFLSRIIPEKGCDDILSAVRALNRRGLSERFSVDFYGPIAKEYDSFLSQIAHLPNVSYSGFLDLRIVENYEKLAAYGAMLFPSYWQGEGFPGVIVDAFVAGLPVIASDWNMNSELIETDVNGTLIPVRSVETLCSVMQTYMRDIAKVNEMKVNAQDGALAYDVRKCISMEQLIDMRIIDE